MCKPGFNSDDLGDEFCYRPNCFIHHDERMQKGCVPVYHEDNCCPWEWICPKAGGGVTDDPEEAAGTLFSAAVRFMFVTITFTIVLSEVLWLSLIFGVV